MHVYVLYVGFTFQIIKKKNTINVFKWGMVE